MPKNQPQKGRGPEREVMIGALNEWAASGLSRNEFVQGYNQRNPGREITETLFRNWAKRAERDPLLFDGVEDGALRRAQDRVRRFSEQEKADVLDSLGASGQGIIGFVRDYNKKNPGRTISEAGVRRWKAAREQGNQGGVVAPSRFESFGDRPVQPVQPVQLPQQRGQPVAAPYGGGGEGWVPAATGQLGASSVAAPTEPSAPWPHDPWCGAGSESGSGEEWAAGRAGSLHTGHGQSSAPPSPIAAVNPAELLYERGGRTAFGEGFAGPSQTAGHSQSPPAAYSTPYAVSYTPRSPIAYSQSFGTPAGYASGGYAGQGSGSSAPQSPPPGHGYTGKGNAQRPGR